MMSLNRHMFFASNSGKRFKTKSVPKIANDHEHTYRHNALVLNKGSFTYCAISRGGFQMLTGEARLAVDYVIKILIFTLIPI